MYNNIVISSNFVTHLKLKNNFNESLDNLSNSIIHLSFELNDVFNQPIDNLPNSIIYLIFDEKSKFNQPIDNLPNSIIYLIHKSAAYEKKLIK
jgi:hypothetical protein